MKKRIKNQSGFTLLELLFAITLMGVMLSIALVAVIGMLRFYVFSNQIRQNQENGRNILDTMVREIRFGSLLFPNDATATSTRVCILDKTNTQLIEYKLISSSLQRSIYTYSPTEPPKDCNDDGLTIVAGPKSVNYDKMRIIDFQVSKTQGAEIEVNTSATAIVLSLQYLTGQPDPADSTSLKCRVADIYCSNLVLNTAVNMRGKAF